jgi:hypothetical protein
MGLLLLVGEIADKPVVVDGRVEIRPILPITATIDHRYADGWHISQLLKPFRAYLADPSPFEPPVEPATPEEAAVEAQAEMVMQPDDISAPDLTALTLPDSGTAPVESFEPERVEAEPGSG